MPSQETGAKTVLGKVSVTPKGDYNSGTTYYALDIVGHEGGSYLAMKEVTGVEPSNDGVNWMQLSGPGLPGVDGVTFTPSVSEAGVISWTNDGEEENPDPVDIMGPPGTAAGFGTVTATADNTSSETPSVDVQSSGPDTAKNFTFAFSGLKGKPGDTPDIEIGTVNTLEPGQDATADITGTTPNLSLSLGIPKGQPGTSVSRIERTSGTGAPGTTDTYTMYDSNDDAIGTFTVYNGANGAGAGDFMADGSVPMTGPLNMGGNKITNLGAPGADTDAVRKSDLDAVAAEVDGILDGTTPAHLAPATDTKIGGVIIGDGLSVEADGTLSADDQLPAGGETGQVLTKTAEGSAWEDAPSGLPDGGTDGQILKKTESGAQWVDAEYLPLSGGNVSGDVNVNGDVSANRLDVSARVDIGSSRGNGSLSVLGFQYEGAPSIQLSSYVYQSVDKNAEFFVGPRPSSSGDFGIRLNSIGSIVSGDPGSVTILTMEDGINLSMKTGTSESRVKLHGIGDPTSDNDAANKAYVDALKPTRLTAVLSASRWSGNSQTITVNGVITNTSAQDIDISCADKASADAWAAGGVWCSNPTRANKLTFTCTTPPTANINLNIRLWEVG